MSNPMQQVQDNSIRLIVLVDRGIFTLIWVTDPADESRTGWYNDEPDIPYFCGATCQVAAAYLRAEGGR